MIDYRIYLVTDEPSRYKGNWLDNIRAAVDGGVTCVQYRDTQSPIREQYARILALRDAIGTTPVIVNNDAELARAVRADGVHVGQSDLPPTEVRAIVGRDCEIGLSITAPGQVAAIDRAAVDCIGIGPVFDARKTKANAADAMGTSGLRAVVDLIPDIPNCAIGGITLANAADVLAAGAKGLAVVSAFSQAPDPYATARQFRALFESARQHPPLSLHPETPHPQNPESTRENPAIQSVPIREIRGQNPSTL